MSLFRPVEFALATVMLCGAGLTYAHAKPFMIVGNDEKVTVGRRRQALLSPPGKDSVLIVDLANPEDPEDRRHAAAEELGRRPAGQCRHRSDRLGRAGRELRRRRQGRRRARSRCPTTRSTSSTSRPTRPSSPPPSPVGKQPSGLSISPAGNLALVANRADNSISVLSIKGTDVKLDRHRRRWATASRMSLFTPDGKRALAVQVPGPQGRAARRQRRQGDLRQARPADRPLALQRRDRPDGKLALTADNGNAGASDGNVDTVSVIDLEANPPRIIDHVVVGDGPEGLAISPKGDFAVAVDPARLQRQQEGLLLQPERQPSRAEDRRQEGDQDSRTSRSAACRKPWRSRRTAISLGRQLHRPGLLDPEGRRHQGHRHRQALQGAGSSGLGADGALKQASWTEPVKAAARRSLSRKRGRSARSYAPRSNACMASPRASRRLALK